MEPRKPIAKGGVAVICFLLILVGQGWLLRGVLAGGLSALTVPYWIELVFCVLLVAGIVVCCVRPLGWTSKRGVIGALALAAVYTIFMIVTYPTFAEAYRVGLDAEHLSAGGAMVGVKFVVLMIGVTAAIPVTPMDPRVYSQRLLEKTERQSAEWAKANVKGAKADLTATLERLKGTLSEEELAELAAELNDVTKKKAEKQAEPEEAAAEQFKGWGGGM